MNALVLINKPVDYRSTKCVAIARKNFGGLKVGHAGTLDSTASGLLVLLVGNATRFCEFVMSLPKVYRAVIQFGAETDTCDYSGNITAENGFVDFDVRALNDALFSFSGWRLQSPPAISAVKIDGKPAHELARSGQEIEIKSRPVFFRRINILTPFNFETGTLELEVSCGRGTYIRSLARDLGKISGTGAYVKELERVSIGKFTLKDANSPDDEEYNTLPLSRLAENFTRIYVSPKDAKSFTNGLSILLRQSVRVSRGIADLRDLICVEGDNFLGFGTYAGYDYIKPLVIVPK